MAIGAFISSNDKMALLKENPMLGHITTFGGHPVNCAASLATLKTLIDEPEIIGSVSKKEKLFRDNLIHPKIKKIRGKGLMLAIELDNEQWCTKLVEKGYDEGIITFFFLFSKTAVRISPPLTISEEQIIEACHKIKHILNQI